MTVPTDAVVATRSTEGSDHGDGLVAYSEAMRRIPLLSAESELALAAAAREGDSQARRRLIEANLRLVLLVARRHAGRGVPLADLVQEGNLGLLHAVDKFDPERGLRFSTYAYRWILRGVIQALFRGAYALPLPAHVGEDLQAMRRTESRLAVRLRRMPSSSELAAELGISEARLRLLRGVHRQPESLEHDSSEEGLALLESVADPAAVDPCESACARLAEEELAEMIAALPPRERLVLCLRHGLDGQPTCTYREIGDRLGLSRETVRKIDRRLREQLLTTPPHAQRVRQN